MTRKYVTGAVALDKIMRREWIEAAKEPLDDECSNITLASFGFLVDPESEGCIHLHEIDYFSDKWYRVK